MILTPKSFEKYSSIPTNYFIVFLCWSKLYVQWNSQILSVRLGRLGTCTNPWNFQPHQDVDSFRHSRKFPLTIILVNLHPLEKATVLISVAVGKSYLFLNSIIHRIVHYVFFLSLAWITQHNVFEIHPYCVYQCLLLLLLLLLNSMPLLEYATVCFSRPLLMDIWVDSSLEL